MSEKISDYTMQELSDRLMLCTCNFEANESSLMNFPHVKKGELALYVQVATPDAKKKDGIYTSWLTVTNDRLNAWGISKEVLFEIASESSKNINPVSMSVIGEGDKMMYLTNEHHYYGASAFFYGNENMLDDICDDLECEELSIFVAGSDQVIIVSTDFYKDDLEELRSSLKTMMPNGEEILPSHLGYKKGTDAIFDVEINVRFSADVKEEMSMPQRHR